MTPNCGEIPTIAVNYDMIFLFRIASIVTIKISLRIFSRKWNDPKHRKIVILFAFLSPKIQNVSIRKVTVKMRFISFPILKVYKDYKNNNDKNITILHREIKFEVM